MLTALQILALPAAALLAPLYALWVLVRGREGWVKHQASRVLPIAPRDLYRLLDPESPENRLLRRGCVLTPLARDQFRMTDPRLPEEPMLLTITQAAPGMVLAFSARRETPCGREAVQGSATRYDFEASGGGTRLTHQEFTRFRPDVSVLGHAFHELLLRFAIGIDLARLKQEVLQAPPGRPVTASA